MYVGCTINRVSKPLCALWWSLPGKAATEHELGVSEAVFLDIVEAKHFTPPAFQSADHLGAPLASMSLSGASASASAIAPAAVPARPPWPLPLASEPASAAHSAAVAAPPESSMPQPLAGGSASASARAPAVAPARGKQSKPPRTESIDPLDDGCFPHD